jgi:hypothetical protein
LAEYSNNFRNREKAAREENTYNNRFSKAF